MLSLYLILAAAVAMGASGLPTCLFPPRSRWGQAASALLMSAGGILGLSALVIAGFPAGAAGGAASVSLAWTLPWGNFALALDPLGAVFLSLIFIVPPLGSIYGLEYWRQSEHPRSGRRLALAFGVLAGAMVFVVLARDGTLFLIAWEIMALAAYFALSASDEGLPLRRAGWVYLIATHMGTLCLFAMFALWRGATGSFSLTAAPALGPGVAGATFVLALVGFGFKAGFLPLHFWLPGAHANAPSHVSAVMSGVMLKMGVYGILRMCSLMPAPPGWWGGTFMAVGAATGLAGIVFAIGQGDVKRVLAYSSVENLGIVAMGMGLALLGRGLGRPELLLLGLGGALLHVWNHGLFKPLLFFGAGAVMHATGTRDIEKLGGLAKRAPILAALFLLAAVAICGLPPLNGFASEWLLYLGFFKALGPSQSFGPGPGLAASAAVALAMIGALAVACFVRLYGGIFLGAARSEAGERGRDPGPAMLLPMAALALACAAVGLAPGAVIPAIGAAVDSFSGACGDPALGAGAAASLGSLAPLGWIGALGSGLAAAAALVLLCLRRARRRAPKRLTWDCGYARPTARMQYTASSFGDSILGLFAAPFAQKVRPRGPKGFFPAAARYGGELPDAVLDGLVIPAASAFDKLLPRFRVFQKGQTHLYILYVLVITIVLFALGGVGVPQ
jgi:hydrogenase-4 component B